jgi:hypothetical protein
MPKILPFQRVLIPLILCALAVLSLLSLARAIYLTAQATGALDFHPYWYYAHFVRAGINPYIAYEQQMLLPEAAHYLDGSVVAPEAVRQRQLAPIPANTASTLLISLLFTYFPWHLVKYGWFALNFVLLLVMPWLALRLLPRSLQLTQGLRWMAALSFWAIKGPRVALANGQPSILLFFLMIVTLLLRERYWLWAGLALGVALGKYSIALPVAFFLLLEGRIRLLIVAGGVQVASLLAVAALEGGSLWDTLLAYWHMVTIFSRGEQGVHLGYMLRDFPALALGLTVMGTLLTLWFTLREWRRGLMQADVLPINSLLALWTLVGAYHRPYDTMLALFFLIVILSALTRWELPAQQVRRLGISWLVMLFFLCLPGEILGAFLAETHAERAGDIINAAVTVTLVIMWGVNLWLLPRVPRLDA